MIRLRAKSEILCSQMQDLLSLYAVTGNRFLKGFIEFVYIA